MKNLPYILIAAALVLPSCQPERSAGTSGQQGNSAAAKPFTSILDVKAVVGKTPEQVEAQLGRPDNSNGESFTDGPCRHYKCKEYTYQNGKIEIDYINGKADWITLPDVSAQHIAFTPEAIRTLGLPPAEPTKNAPGQISWAFQAGIREIEVGRGAGDEVGMIYIEAIHSVSDN